MYLGLMSLISALYMTHKLPRLDTIFGRISAIDREITKLLKSNEKIRKSNGHQFRFELACVVWLTISFIITTAYDCSMYPE